MINSFEGILLAIFDGIPPILFLIGTIYMTKVIDCHSGKRGYAIFTAGSIVCFIGGMYKWIGKLIMAISNTNIIELNDTLFMFIAPGYLFLSIGMYLAYKGVKETNEKNIKLNTYGIAALPLIPFIGAIFVFTITFYSFLIKYLIKIKEKKFITPYLVSCILTCSMSFISRLFENVPGIGSFYSNFIAQSINTLNYLIFAVVTINLYKKVKRRLI